MIRLDLTEEEAVRVATHFKGLTEAKQAKFIRELDIDARLVLVVCLAITEYGRKRDRKRSPSGNK